MALRGNSLRLAAGVVAYLAIGKDSPIKLVASQNALQIKAAGVNYAGWPEMGIKVNGEKIGSITIDSQQQKMFSIDVPGNIGEIKQIQLTLDNFTECQTAYAPNCKLRSIVFKELYLNDERLEGGVPSGAKNFAHSIQSGEGGITWDIEG